MKIKDTLAAQFGDLLTEDTLNIVQEAFDAAVETKVTEKVDLEVKAAVTKLDEDHGTKLQQLVEAIDEDHTNKLQKLVETIDFDHAVKLQRILAKIDEDHAEKLQAVVDKYEKVIGESAEEFRGRLVEEISNYMDLYLEKNVPTEQIQEAVENIKSRKLIEQIRSLVGVNEEFIDTEVKEALSESKEIIGSLKKELNESVLLNTRLNHSLQKANAAIILEQKTKELPEAIKAFAKKVLSGKTPEYIEENFSYVVELYDNETAQKEDFARTGATARVLTEAVDRPEGNDNQVEIVENFGQPSVLPVDGYLSEMTKLDRSTTKRNL